MIAIIDSYDSFVFNIARYFHKLSEATEVIRNDAISISELVRLDPRAVVILPGPCTPTEAGISQQWSGSFLDAYQFWAFALDISVLRAFLEDGWRERIGPCTVGAHTSRMTAEGYSGGCQPRLKSVATILLSSSLINHVRRTS
ncbi:hypothetical protein ACVW16_005185 [Bradyrhizobium sp. USDA 4474]